MIILQDNDGHNTGARMWGEGGIVCGIDTVLTTYSILWMSYYYGNPWDQVDALVDAILHTFN